MVRNCDARSCVRLHDLNDAVRRQWLHAWSLESTATRNIRNCGSQFVFRTPLLQCRRLLKQAFRNNRNPQGAIPSGVIQCFQSRESWTAKHACGLAVRWQDHGPCRAGSNEEMAVRFAIWLLES